MPAYEKAHQVLITDEAIHAAARLSADYIKRAATTGQSPLIPSTPRIARVSTSLTAPPRALSHARQRIRQCQAEYDMLLRDQQYGLSEENQVLQAVQVRIDQTQAQITTLEQDWQIEHAAIQAYLQARQQLNETNA